jgi:hypothetical protein
MEPSEFAEKYPDTVKDWHNEGFTEGHSEAIKEERERAKALQDAFPDRPGFALEQYMKGRDIGKAKAELSDVVLKELEQSKKDTADAQAKLAEATGGEADAIDLDPGADVSNDAKTKYDDIKDDGDRIAAEWKDNLDGCQEKFKQPSTYAAYRRSQIEAAA